MSMRKKHHSIEVSRTISQKADKRTKVAELLALY